MGVDGREEDPGSSTLNLTREVNRLRMQSNELRTLDGRVDLSLAAWTKLTLRVSTSPRGAFASHSSTETVVLGVTLERLGGRLVAIADGEQVGLIFGASATADGCLVLLGSSLNALTHPIGSIYSQVHFHPSL